MEHTAEKSLAYTLAEARPRLILSNKSYIFSIPEGETVQEVLQLRAEDNSPVSGRIYSAHHRIISAHDHLRGDKPEVTFGIDTRGLHIGDSIDGELCLATNLGEIQVPIHAEITGAEDGVTNADVETLEDFGNLCEKNFRKGFKLFTKPDFVHILNGKNRPFVPLYRGLSQNPVTYQHLEEFLVSTGRKEEITVSMDKQEKAVYHLQASQKDTLYLYRSTWGYLHLEVEVQGSFLEVQKKSVTTEDFIGKVCGLEYIVNYEKLGQGKSFGRIILRSVHQTLVYEVEASTFEETEIKPVTIRRKRIAWLFRDALNLQLHRMDYPSFLESTSMTVADMLREDSNDLQARFFSAFLAISKEDKKQAVEALWPIREGALDPVTDEEKGCYLYLAKQAELLPIERLDIRGDLRRYYERHPESYLLLYLLRKESNLGEQTTADQMNELEFCAEQGCCSPFLYLAGWKLLKKEESLLRRLSPFMIRVLSFGKSLGEMTQGLVLRTAFLADSMRGYSRPLYRLLSGFYKEYQEDALLESVTKLIIKDHPIRTEYFPWYRLAIEKDLRITRLYEYYMETFTGTAHDEIPTPVKIYFSYNSNGLSEKKRALLYAHVILHKQEDATSYDNYAGVMKKFASAALEKGRLDENYRVLYTEFFANPQSVEEAELMADVLFAHRLQVKDQRLRKVVVVHNAFTEEDSYRITDGVAFPRIYGEDSCIFFEDDKKRRFANTVEYEMTPVTEDRELIKNCIAAGAKSSGILLSQCKEKPFQMEVNSKTLRYYEAAVGESDFTREYRRAVRKKLLHFYLEHIDEDEIQDSLHQLEAPSYGRADKVMTAELLVRTGRLADAFTLLSVYGYEQVPVDILLRLARGIILSGDKDDDEELLCLVEYVYDHGKYDDSMLRYLVRNYAGPIDKMSAVWETARGFKLDTLALEERVMRQSVFVRKFPPHMASIMAGFMRQHGPEQVVDAFMTMAATAYYTEDKKFPQTVFFLLEKMLQRSYKLETVCMLAMLKCYAEQGMLTEESESLCKTLLAAADRLQLRFEFYNQLPEELTQAYQIEDKIFIEERFVPGSRVLIHYRLTEANGESTGWITEPMKEMYLGVFSREFLLFYGETLTYYLSVTENGETTDTDSYELSLVDIDTSGSTRYKLLNRMLEANAQGDNQGLKAAMEQYCWQETCTNQVLQKL